MVCSVECGHVETLLESLLSLLVSVLAWLLQYMDFEDWVRDDRLRDAHQFYAWLTSCKGQAADDRHTCTAFAEQQSQVQAVMCSRHSIMQPLWQTARHPIVTWFVEPKQNEVLADVCASLDSCSL